MEQEVKDKILVVEDDPVLLETLQYNLERQGYQVITAADGMTAIDLARRERPDVIVLDVMIPQIDGFEVCRILRQEMNIPILMLTARDDEIDKVVGLEVGADDYMTKPFSMRELLARVKALLRRVRLIRGEMAATAAPDAKKLVFGDLVLDLTRGEVQRGGKTVPLTPKEYELLVFLARNRGRVLSRDLILERVWGWDFAGGTRTVDVHYGDFRAVKDITIKILRRKITAIIGPSGCGKSTLLRTFNRMNDLIPGSRVEGKVFFDGCNIYDQDVDPVEVRRRIGMVFQKPNPFPKSIYENVAWGARINGFRGDMDALVEQSLRRAALWDQVKDNLRASALTLSGGQQQRLCIARVIAIQPEVILMDEPASALDPIATLKIEDLMRELVRDYTIIIVTHNMQEAARVSDYAAFLMMDEDRAGMLVEYGPTSQVFTTPRDKRTEDYITGRFG